MNRICLGLRPTCLPSAKTALLVIALALVGRVAHCGEPVNVLWLTVEDMSPWIACYGDSTVPTPNLDRLAGESVRYTNAFASSPVCAPARSSLITGMFATRIGTMHMRTSGAGETAYKRNPEMRKIIPVYQGTPPAFVSCFPEQLRASGVYCTNNSKTDYQFRAPSTVWDASSNQAHWRKRAEGQPFFAVFNNATTHESQAFPEARRRPAAVKAEEVPLPPFYPDTSSVRDEVARTYNNIAEMDKWVGERLAELEDAGLAESTVVFFFSDHGVGLPRGKRSPYDLGTRVPLLIRFPDGRGAGTTEERVVSFVDFGPTVLSINGIEPDERLDGKAFLGEHKTAGSGYAFAHADRFDSVYDKARSVSDGRFRLVRNYKTDLPYVIPNAYRERLKMTADIYALRESGPQRPEQWQMAARERPREELYDSKTDPWEVENLIDQPSHRAKLAELRSALDAWIEQTGDPALGMPEREFVERFLWPPDGKQPATAAPVITINDGMVTITSTTEGASIGYRYGRRGVWQVYTGPFAISTGPALHAVAHRIGWKPAWSRQRSGE